MPAKGSGAATIAMRDLYEVECFSRRNGWRRTGTVFQSWQAGAKWLAQAKHPEKWRLVPMTMDTSHAR